MIMSQKARTNAQSLQQNTWGKRRLSSRLFVLLSLSLMAYALGCGNVQYEAPSSTQNSKNSGQMNPAPAPTPAPAPLSDKVVSDSSSSFVDNYGGIWKIDPNKFAVRNDYGVTALDIPGALFQTSTLVFHQTDKKVYAWGANGVWYVYDDDHGTLVQASSPALNIFPGPFSRPAMSDVKLFPGNGGSLLNKSGLWTFDTSFTSQGNMVFIDGSSAGGASGIELDIIGGEAYLRERSGTWRKYSGSGWTTVASPL